jgi:serine protease DegS
VAKNTLIFIVQSAIAGLALAFVVTVLVPEFAGRSAGEPETLSSGYAKAVERSSPSVVNIITERAVGGERVLGSGVIMNAGGYVVTNWHVVSGADQIGVQLADGRVAVPELVGADPETELALLRIRLDDLPVIRLGRSDSLKVGEVVLAIGNSLGLSQTVTMGIVSATGRGQLGVATFEDFIQTDAAINIGNSGGALVNTEGELVGINTAVISPTSIDQTPPEGIGFAIPVNLVRGVMEQLIEHGRVIRGYLGIETSDLTPGDAAALGIDGPAVVVKRVNGPAAEAGLVPGDVVTRIDGQRITSERQVTNLIASAQPGDRVEIRIVRGRGERLTTEAVLGERPPREGS